METLGEFLKSERESRNVTLEEISNTTRINLKILDALENDDRESLPGDTFNKGFLKAYAKYLDLNETDVLLRYDHFYKTEEHPKDEYKFDTIDDFFTKKSKNSFLYIVIGIAVVWLLITIFTSDMFKGADEPATKEEITEEVNAGGIVIENKKTKPKPAKTEKPASKKSAQKAVPLKKAPAINKSLKSKKKTTDKAPLKPKAEEQKKKAGQSPFTPIVEGEGHKVVLRADALVWMQIQIDDNEPYEVMLSADEVYRASAAYLFRLKIGDAGKLKVELDGNDLGYLGGDEEVKRVTLPYPAE